MGGQARDLGMEGREDAVKMRSKEGRKKKVTGRWMRER